MTTVHSSRLRLSALAAASSFIALSAPAQAQSVCTSVAGVVTCTNGAATTSLDAGATLTSTTQGLQITDTTPLTLVLGGTVNTDAALQGLTLRTTGGDLVVTGATGGAINLVGTGTGTGATLTSTTGAINATLGTVTVAGPYAVLASGATGVNLTTGAVTDTAVNASTINVLGRNVGSAATATAATGPASLTVNGALTAAGTFDPIVGALANAPAGAASATVTGATTVTNTTGAAVGVAALGQTGATVVANGPVTVSGGGTGAGSITTTGLAALVSGTGTASVTCGGNVTVSGAGSTAITAQGTDVTIACPNSTLLVTGSDGYGVDAIATNSITARVGNVTVNGAGGAGIELDAAGPITLVAGNVATNGTSTPGVLVAGGTGNVSLTTGTVTASGLTSTGINATTTSGTLTVNSGKVTATGVGISTRTDTGAQAITVAGVQAGLHGINAVATGSAPITITATAPITAADGYAIQATGTTGAIVVAEAGATGTNGALRLTNTGTGAITATATGGTTTATLGDAINVSTLGAATVNVNAGATVRGQGASDAIDIRGTTANTVNIAGTVTSDAAGFAVNASGAPATVNILSGGVVTGQVKFTGATNDDVLNVAGTYNASGTSQFGGGNDTLNVQSGGVLRLADATSMTSLQTLNNSGRIEATGTTTLATTIFNNNAGGVVTSTSGNATLAGLATFNNAGRIDMVDGVPDDSLTIASNYAASGGARLAVDVNGPTGASDRLIVGGNITGSTVIDVNVVGGPATYNPAGLLIVDGQGTVAAGAFTLDQSDRAQGFLNYGLSQGGTGGNDTRLVTTLDNSITDLGLAGSLGQEMWYQSFDAYNDGVRGRHAGAVTSGHPIGIWGQMYRSNDSYGDDGRSVTTATGTLNYSDELRTERGGVQGGLEFRGAGFVIGATGGYEWAGSRDHPAAVLSGEGHNYGAYALVGMANGLYAGVMYKRDEYRVHFSNSGRGVVADFENAVSEGVDGEIGLRSTAGGIGIDLQAGLSYVKTRLGTNTQQGLTFGWDDNRSTRGRLGARLSFPQAMGVFVGAKVFHEFKDDGVFRVSANGADVANIAMPHRGTWARIEGGLDGFLGLKGAQVTLWGDLGETKSFGGRVGFRF